MGDTYRTLDPNEQRTAVEYNALLSKLQAGWHTVDDLMHECDVPSERCYDLFKRLGALNSGARLRLASRQVGRTASSSVIGRARHAREYHVHTKGV